MRLYIIRHADPDYPNRTITPAGHEEARALAKRLEREGINRLFSSPLGRALHTAKYAADRLGLEAGIEDWTQELGAMVMREGPCRGLMAWDLHGHVLRTDPRFAAAGDWAALPPLDGAVFRSEFARVQRCSDEFLTRLGYQREGGRYRVLRASTDRVAVVCHGGLGLTWLAHLLEIPLPLMWAGFWLPPSSVSVVLMDQRCPEWATPRALCVGDTSHLHAEGLPVQAAGIKANFD